MKTVIHWFRRDLRLEDNTALFHALSQHNNVQCVFIFDENITDELPNNDHRISFIYKTLYSLNKTLNQFGSSLKIYKGKPIKIMNDIISKNKVTNVYVNKDYEPYAIKRDNEIKSYLKNKKINFHSFKDHVIFEENEITKNDGTPYTIYTPYSRKWIEKFNKTIISTLNINKFFKNLKKSKKFDIPSLKSLKFIESKLSVSNYIIDHNTLASYDENRNLPYIDGTSKIGPYLRFGLLSIRSLVNIASNQNITFLKELIWREFFMQILFNFPHVLHRSFKSKYDRIIWENNKKYFDLWCAGKTGYPIVDAGIRELNSTGFMHNRVRMIVASFLCKHLLTDWKFGEAYFAKKLFDYELASNNGNWQWAAGCGCDAAPYFRVFNPYTQQKRFDCNFEYIKKWVPEYDSNSYIKPIVDHNKARIKAIELYKYYL